MKIIINAMFLHHVAPCFYSTNVQVLCDAQMCLAKVAVR